ncbi:MAG TPA: GTP-binding protein, partial [Draconibacterium sp.]|nr:GTP-binding protein [Draconibacterium sp.]
MNRIEKINVTIITGFLGAGKTTFINQLLKQNSETQFALVENEFGDVAIDTKLIKGVDASQMFELKQGCICCTISDEFELVLQELAEKFPNVKHLLIETTGIA